MRRGVCKTQSCIQLVSNLVAVSVPGRALQPWRDLGRLWPVRQPISFAARGRLLVDFTFVWLLFPTLQPLVKTVSAAFDTMPSIIGKSESDTCCVCSLGRTPASDGALEDTGFASIGNMRVPKQFPC